MIKIDRFLRAHAVYEGNDHKEVTDDETEGCLIYVGTAEEWVRREHAHLDVREDERGS